MWMAVALNHKFIFHTIRFDSIVNQVTEFWCFSRIRLLITAENCLHRKEIYYSNRTFSFTTLDFIGSPFQITFFYKNGYN